MEDSPGLKGDGFFELYGNRKLKLEGAYDKDGMYYGTHRFWNESGYAEFEAEFKRGIQISASRLFPNGRPEWKKTFNSGRFHGVHRMWHVSGRILEEISWREGRLHGRSKNWHKNGRIKSERIYNKGKLEYFREWDADGMLIAGRN